LPQINNNGTDVVEVTWVLEGVMVKDATDGVIGSLRSSLQNYFRGEEDFQNLYRLDHFLVTKIAPWQAVAATRDQDQGLSALYMLGNGSSPDSVRVTVQVNLLSNDDAPMVVAALRDALASGETFVSMQAYLPSLPLLRVSDPGDGSGKPVVKAPAALPTTLPPIPSSGPSSGSGKKKNQVGLEVALGVAGGALVVGLVVGAYIMYWQRQSDAHSLEEKRQAEKAGQIMAHQMENGSSGGGGPRELVIGGGLTDDDGVSTKNPANAPYDTGTLTSS